MQFHAPSCTNICVRARLCEWIRSPLRDVSTLCSSDSESGVWGGRGPHHVSDDVFHASDSEHHDQGDHADVPRYR